MKWVLDQDELRSRVSKALELTYDRHRLASMLVDEIYSDAKQVMVLPERGVISVAEVASVLYSAKEDLVGMKKVDDLVGLLAPAIQAAVDEIAHSARVSNVFLVGIATDQGIHQFLAKEGMGLGGLTSNRQEAAVFSREDALSMAQSDERYSALPFNIVALISGRPEAKPKDQSEKHSSEEINAGESSSQEIEKGYSKALEDVLALFQSDLGFCHDPMGQESINRLEEAIKSLSPNLQKLGQSRNPGM